MKQTENKERGVLATAFWSAIETRLADPELAELVNDPTFATRLSDETDGLLKEISNGVFETVMGSVSATARENNELRRAFESLEILRYRETVTDKGTAELVAKKR